MGKNKRGGHPTKATAQKQLDINDPDAWKGVQEFEERLTAVEPDFSGRAEEELAAIEELKHRATRRNLPPPSDPAWQGVREADERAERKESAEDFLHSAEELLPREA